MLPWSALISTSHVAHHVLTFIHLVPYIIHVLGFCNTIIEITATRTSGDIKVIVTPFLQSGPISPSRVFEASYSFEEIPEAGTSVSIEEVGDDGYHAPTDMDIEEVTHESSRSGSTNPITEEIEDDAVNFANRIVDEGT